MTQYLYRFFTKVHELVQALLGGQIDTHTDVLIPQCIPYKVNKLCLYLLLCTRWNFNGKSV